MVVGHDVTGFGNKEARAERARLTGAGLLFLFVLTVAHIVIEARKAAEALEEFLHIAHAADFAFRYDVDAHHCRADILDQVGEAHRSAIWRRDGDWLLGVRQLEGLRDEKDRPGHACTRDRGGQGLSRNTYGFHIPHMLLTKSSSSIV